MGEAEKLWWFSLSENHTFYKHKASFLSEHLKKCASWILIIPTQFAGRSEELKRLASMVAR
ncbi:hypothetical protein LEP1GSC137_4634 [Leptospira borgpetersenii str. Noumea 25]|uniref:Uncharacterized protein n=1 Tax=Leptospira borgpetersenii serovar Ballum TaxID=280505 RepID=A0A0E3B3R4_LEPBO|nr:hypothetical protein LBBP_01323 [Leptospira borgpetersenii serovar Ballum]EKR00759.1 hypothetical protein LEP1GSC121_0011 [Leptospira borgpetersenii serovar Castellonis str. 200801910]EMO10999.1 hypothetical protein LEP1GSC137_4634 [Leptospira borgpetersenii str. Noumea 25]KGE24165.1 hypothetical protein IQ66_09345 [Leptospira borgpetersenii serovar Ballum]OOV41045.1 hypothetical protein B1H38_18485 [Leptospira borgpetersenii serovar Ballum]